MEKLRSYESTWFSNERTMGYCEVLKALSAIASITSCHKSERGRHFCSKCISSTSIWVRLWRQEMWVWIEWCHENPANGWNQQTETIVTLWKHRERRHDKQQNCCFYAETLKSAPSLSHLKADSKLNWGVVSGPRGLWCSACPYMEVLSVRGWLGCLSVWVFVCFCVLLSLRMLLLCDVHISMNK